MKKTLFILLCCLFTLQLSAQKRDKVIVKMGETYGRDSSKYESRNFPRKLVVAKNQIATGVTVMNVSLNADDADVMLFLRDADAAASLTRISAGAMYSYGNNVAFGLKAAYGNYQGHLGKGTLDLLNDGLQFGVSGLNVGVHSFSAIAFHRNYFGLDDKGRFALFCDLSLGYKYSKSDAIENAFSRSDKIFVSFAPGLEVWLMNFVSLRASISLATLSYTWSRAIQDGQQTGTANDFKALARVNLVDMDLGINFYF